jgi:hypothetical protein
MHFRIGVEALLFRYETNSFFLMGDFLQTFGVVFDFLGCSKYR